MIEWGNFIRKYAQQRVLGNSIQSSVLNRCVAPGLPVSKVTNHK